MINFQLTTELQLVHRRDFQVANNTLLNPTNANPIIDGEFMEIDSAYKLIRAGNGKALPGIHRCNRRSLGYRVGGVG